MNFKYKVAAALISLPLFFSVLFYPCLQIRASAAGSSWVDSLAAYQVSKWEDLPSDFQALAEAYVNTFNSIGTKGYFDSAIDIPLNWYYILDDSTPVLSIGGAVFYYLDGNGNLKYTKKGSSGSGNSITDNATIVSSRNDLVVDGKRFKKYLDDNSNDFAPTGRVSKVSWKTDKYFSSSTYDNVRNWSYLTFLARGNFFGVSDLKEFYCVPFFEDSEGEIYFGNYCGYFRLTSQVADSSGTVEYDLVFKYVDVINNFGLSNSDKYLSLFEYNSFTFSDFEDLSDDVKANFLKSYYCSCFCDSKSFLVYPSFSAFLDRGDISSFSYPNYLEFLKDFYNSKNISLKISDVFNRTNFPNGSISNAPCDWGFYISDTPILMDGFGSDIDTTKIPDNYYITVGGDTIYDYNITNPATGDSTTINNYVTNNYIFNGSGESSTGSTVNNYYDGATINNGDNHYYDGATINNGDNHYYEGATINNGDNITNNYNFSDGDTNFFTQIGVEIQNALSVAFVPSDGFMDSFNADMRSTLESKMPFVYDLGDIFNSLFVDIVDNNLVYVSDVNSDGSVDESSIIYPKWTFNVNFFGTDYELIYMDFSMYSESFFYIRLVVASFTYLGFFVMLLKSLPGIIGSIGDLVGAAAYAAPYIQERFSDVKDGD